MLLSAAACAGIFLWWLLFSVADAMEKRHAAIQELKSAVDERGRAIDRARKALSELNEELERMSNARRDGRTTNG